MAYIEHIKGNTDCIVTQVLRLPFYRLNDRDIVLMDSGFHDQEEELLDVLSENCLHVRAILTTHMHVDHVGNHRRLQERDGAEVCLSLFDTGASQDLTTLGSVYFSYSPELLDREYSFMVQKPDHIIFPGDTQVVIDGVSFEVLRLPGHSHMHLGYLTPDRVAYVGDAVSDENTLRQFRFIFAQNWAQMFSTIDRLAETDHDAYVVAHNKVVDDIRPLAQYNRQMLRSKLYGILYYAQDWIPREDFIAAIAREHIRRPDDLRGIRHFRRILQNYIHYLEDQDALTAEIRGGKEYVKSQWSA